MRKESVVLDENLQITIPQSFVNALGLQIGDMLYCYLHDGKMIIEPTNTRIKDQQ